MSFGERLSYRYRAWRYRLKVEAPEIAFVLKTLSPGDTAIDIGAHKGAFTYWMRHAVGREGRVFAFEPQPILAEKLRRILPQLGFDNVTVEAAGLSSTEGGRILFVPAGGPAPGASLEADLAQRNGQKIEVSVTTLDSFLRERDVSKLRLIKCDVEGHELDVFRGAEETLRRVKPVLLFECEARHHPSGRIEAVFEYLESLGYHGQFFWQGELLDRTEFRAEQHQVPDQKPYANNFVFTGGAR